MTQRLLSGTALAQACEQAWSRIGLSPWDHMAWFAKLANATLETLSPGDIQNVQDECQALRMTPIAFSLTRTDLKRYPFKQGGLGSFSPALPELKNICEVIALHLSLLADGKSTNCGPIRVDHTITFTKSNEVERHNGYPPYRINTPLIFSKGDTWSDEFLFRMTQLLQRPRRDSALFVDSIRRCPHCQQVFVQNHRNATYCGRKCHSVAGMRKARATAKEQQQGQRPKTKRGKGTGHGKKKRH